MPGGGDYEEQRIFRASPSSVSSAGKCWRQWCAKALGRIAKQETPAQKFGTNLHGMAEVYLLTGAIPDQHTAEGRLMVEGIPHLPKRRLLPNEVEGEISFTFADVPWIGYYDWKEFDRCVIGDHKTSSDPRQWGLTAEKLPKDLQAGTYAYDAWVKDGWEETNLHWQYYGKKDKTSYPVKAKITKDQATRILEEHAPTALEMQKRFNENPNKLSIDDLNEIENDPSACSYSGKNCDFGEHCQIVSVSKLVRKQRENMPEEMSPAQKRVAELRAKVEAAKNGGTPASAATTPVNPPESAKAIEETVKEVANEAPTEATEPTEPTAPAPAAEQAPSEEKPKNKGGRPKNADRLCPPLNQAPAAPASAPTAPAAESKPSRLEMSQISLADALCLLLDRGAKVTIELG